MPLQLYRAALINLDFLVLVNDLPTVQKLPKYLDAHWCLQSGTEPAHE